MLWERAWHSGKVDVGDTRDRPSLIRTSSARARMAATAGMRNRRPASIASGARARPFLQGRARTKILISRLRFGVAERVLAHHLDPFRMTSG